MSTGARLEVRGLGKTFAGADGEPIVALDGVDLVAEPGELVAILGPSGCGKSTLFHILAGLEQPTAGEVLVDGEPREDRLGLCAFMPQRDGLLPWRRVLDNTTLGLELAGVPRDEARRRAEPLLERFGLGAFARAWPWQLSGGMRQRAAFLRTVLTGRPAMLLDEPFGALDGITRTELQAWLLEVWAEVGSTVLRHHPRRGRGGLPGRPGLRDGAATGAVSARSCDVDLPRPRTLELEETPAFAAAEAALRRALRAQGTRR